MQCILQPTRIIPAVPGSDQLILTLFTLSVYPSVHNQLIQTIFKGRPVCQLDLNKCTIEKNIMIFDWLVVSGQTTTAGIDRPLILYQWTFLLLSVNSPKQNSCINVYVYTGKRQAIMKRAVRIYIRRLFVYLL